MCGRSASRFLPRIARPAGRRLRPPCMLANPAGCTDCAACRRRSRMRRTRMIDDRPPASDEAARQRAIQAGGSVLVQAPAGSGKTTLLVQRYLRLLAMVDAPERILALTFTHSAEAGQRNRALLEL